MNQPFVVSDNLANVLLAQRAQGLPTVADDEVCFPPPAIIVFIALDAFRPETGVFMKAIRKLTALLWAQKHMDQASALCDLGASLQKPQKETIHGLWAGIGATYGKSFTQNDGISALDSKFTKFSDPDFQRRHDWLMEVRHNQLAHKNRVWEESLMPDVGDILVHVSGDGETEWDVQYFDFPNVTFSNVKKLCEYQRARLAQESDGMLKHFLELQGVEGGKTYNLEKDFSDSEIAAQRS